MGLFNFMKSGFSQSVNYSNVPNKSLMTISSRIGKSNDDTVFVSTSRLCPTCSTYNRRVYSLYGRAKAFPALPEFLHADKCPVCGCCIGYSRYFQGINGNLQNDIAFSNRPFEDSRTQEEKEAWENKAKSKKRNKKENQ